MARAFSRTVIVAIVSAIWISPVPLMGQGQRSPSDSVTYLLQAALQAAQHETPDSLQKSLGLFELALRQARAAHDPKAETATLYNLGSLFARLGRKQLALEYYRNTLATVQRINAPTTEAIPWHLVELTTRNRIGQAQLDLGHPDSALADFRAALPLWREIPAQLQKVTTLNGIGLAFLDLGRPDSALAYFREGYSVALELNDEAAEGVTLSNTGAAFQMLGRADSALVFLRRALPIRQKVSDQAGESVTLFYLAEAHLDLNRADSALVYGKRSLDLSRDLDDRKGEAETLRTIGTAFNALGHPDSALVLLDRALGIQQELGLRGQEADTRDVLGTVYCDLGQVDRGLSELRGSLEISRARGDTFKIAREFNSLAKVYAYLEEVDSALTVSGSALTLQRRIGDRVGEMRTLNRIGALYSGAGFADSALSHHRMALRLSRDLQDRNQEISALQGIGDAYSAVFRYDSAFTYYHAAFILARSVGDRMDEGILLVDLGSIFLEHGSRGTEVFPDERQYTAIQFFADALDIFLEMQSLREEGIAGANIGKALESVRRYDEAIPYLERAQEIFQSTGLRSAESSTLISLGTVHIVAGRVELGRRNLQRALVLARETRSREAELLALVDLGVSYHLNPGGSQLGRAVAYYDSAVAILSAIQRSAGGDYNRLGVAERGADLFALWTLAWLSRGPEERGTDNPNLAALAVSERGRAQALRMLMRERGRGSTGSDSTPPGANLFAEGNALVAALARAGTPAISYLVDKDTLIAFWIQPGRDVQVYRTAIQRDTLISLVLELRSELGVDPPHSPALEGLGLVSEFRLPYPRSPGSQDPESWRRPARRLASILIPEALRAQLPGFDELLIVPSGPLVLVPFAALPIGEGVTSTTEPDSLMGLLHSLRFAPSLQLATGILPSERIPASAPSALVIGNPVMPLRPDFDKSPPLTRLLRTASEAVSVAGREGSKPLLDSAATEAAVRARLGSASLVHLATHVQVYATDEYVRESFIALAPTSSFDGRFTLGELIESSPPLRAELVVLAGCETGLGPVTQLEGAIGFQRAFLALGAQRVLASLWKVDVEATGRLMDYFYAGWPASGRSPADALRRAMVELARDPHFRNPRYWAAFQLSGIR